jgi:hypothetical protein
MGREEGTMGGKLWPGERVLTDTSATLVGSWGNANWVNAAGMLYVTNRRLIFEPIGLSFQDRTAIPFDDVASVRPRNFLWIIPDGLEVLTRDGVRYRFKVWSRDHLIDLILAQMKKSSTAPSQPGADE